MIWPLVLKFGGSSVANADRLRNVASIARSEAAANSGGGVLVVLSALGGATDALIGAGALAVAGDETGALAALEALLSRHIDTARELFDGGIPSGIEEAIHAAWAELAPVLRGASLLRELPPRSADLLAGRGELLSTALLAALLDAPLVDARGLMRTDSRFGQARPDEAALARSCAERLVPFLGPGMIAVTQGYIGSDCGGMPTTLGRGGSDYSASLFGAAIGATEIQIWTDVEGVLTADPRLVAEASPVPVLGYAEAAELAAFGAKVLHPATIQPAVGRGIPVTVRNSLMPKGRYTTISAHGRSAGGQSQASRAITAIASRGPVSILHVTNPRMLGGSGFLARIFEVFGRLGASVDLVATSEVSVSVTVEAGAPHSALAEALSAFAEVLVESDRSVLALVGEGMKATPGIAARALSSLAGINVEMISLGASGINLSLVVARGDEAEAVRRLHAEFFNQEGRSGKEEKGRRSAEADKAQAMVGTGVAVAVAGGAGAGAGEGGRP